MPSFYSSSCIASGKGTLSWSILQYIINQGIDSLSHPPIPYFAIVHPSSEELISRILIVPINVGPLHVACWQVLGKVGEGGGTSALRNVRCRQSQSRHSLLAGPGGGLAFKFEKLAAHSFERMVSHAAVSLFKYVYFHPSPFSHQNI